jgi:hypothetical protein
MTRAFTVLFLACALGATGYVCAQQQPGSAVGASASQCRECGVVTGIRELQHERESARTVTERLPPVGPVFSFSFGGDAQTKQPFVGAVGSQEMRDSLVEISYEVTVRFNDGRYGMVETRDGADLRVGDPVKVINNKIELNV